MTNGRKTGLAHTAASIRARGEYKVTGIPTKNRPQNGASTTEAKQLSPACLAHPVNEEYINLRSRDLPPGTGQQRITRSRLYDSSRDAVAIVIAISPNCHFFVKGECRHHQTLFLSPAEDFRVQWSVPFVGRTVRKGRGIVAPVHILVTLRHARGWQTHGSQT